MTITIQEADYAEGVNKQLKDYRRKAKVDGFRPGAVPMGLVKKMYGLSAKLDVVNHLVSDELYKYIEENKIQMLGHALPSERQEPQDLSSDSTHTFVFDIAIAPEFELSLSSEDTLDYYKIKVDDALIDQQVEMFASRQGSYVKAEEYQDKDMLKGDLCELDDEGNEVEGGVSVEDAIVMPSYINNDEQKALFEGAHLGDRLTICPRKMYGDAELAALLKIDKEEALKHEGNFAYTLKEISRYEPAKVDQTLFDSVYGPGTCQDEAAFRGKIAEGLKVQLASDSDYKFLVDLRKYAEEKIGPLTFPDKLLKRVMLDSNKDKTPEDVEKDYEKSLAPLTWHLVKEKLVSAYGIKIDDADLKATAIEAARVQFAQYGMNNVPVEYLENYAEEMLKKRESIDGLVDRAIDVKITKAVKEVVSLNEKEVTIDEFNKLMNEKSES